MLQPLRFIQLKAWGFLLLLFGSFFFSPAQWLIFGWKTISIHSAFDVTRYHHSTRVPWFVKGVPVDQAKTVSETEGDPLTPSCLESVLFIKSRQPLPRSLHFPGGACSLGIVKTNAPPPYLLWSGIASDRNWFKMSHILSSFRGKREACGAAERPCPYIYIL